MNKRDTSKSAPRPGIVEIVDELERHGIDSTSFTLQDYIDVDALEGLLASESANLEIKITIEGIRLEITQEGVQSLN